MFKNGVVIFHNDQIESVKGSHRFIDSLFVNNAIVENNINGDDDVDLLEDFDDEEDGCPVLDSEELQAEMLKNLALLDRKIMENELLVMEQKQLVLKLMSEHQGAFSMVGFSVASVEKIRIELMDPRPQISRVKEMDPIETDCVWSEMIGKNVAYGVD